MFGVSGYMNIHALSRTLGESYAVNAALLETESGAERTINPQMKDVPAVASVEVKKDSYESLMDTLAQSIGIMTFGVLIFSGVIAFAVIYNVTFVSLAERQRELASLRVMGFSNQEVGRILYNENFFTGTIGLILGMPLGAGICWLMVDAFATDLYRIPFYISARTFMVAAVLTALFIAISNFAVRKKIHGLDLVEVLKARD
jgi:putative ABC transport system permease protein